MRWGLIWEQQRLSIHRPLTHLVGVEDAWTKPWSSGWKMRNGS